MANVWRNPIFDRTLDDVTFAVQQIEAWKKSHSHSVDLKIENDKLILNGGGVSYVNNNAFVLQDDGAAFVENEVLIVELGTVYNLKGCLNLSDITRIEDNIAYLSERLTSYRYSIDTNSKEWTQGDLPTAQDMKRIGANIRSIFSGFATPSESDTIPDVMLSYEDINALERNLYLLKQLLDAMELSFIKSGTHKSGATTRLPIRR
jgi:hypothetical protein